MTTDQVILTLREAEMKVWRVSARLQISVRTVSRVWLDILVSKLAEAVERRHLEDH